MPRPLQHRRRDDRRFRGRAGGCSRRGCRGSACAPRARPAGGRRNAGSICAEREVGVAQELGVLVAMRIEGAGDEASRPNHFAHATRDVASGSRDIAHAHRAVQREKGAVERSRRASRSAIIWSRKCSKACFVIQPEPEPVLGRAAIRCRPARRWHARAPPSRSRPCRTAAPRRSSASPRAGEPS